MLREYPAVLAGPGEHAVAEADRKQAISEAEARARGEKHSYSSVLARQKEGPLHHFLIPLGHSRQSRYPLFRKALKCRVIAREADFPAIKVALGIGLQADEELVDDIALDILARTW